jgi:hypothetical protein
MGTVGAIWTANGQHIDITSSSSFNSISQRTLLLLPLGRREALGRPSVNRSDLVFQRTIDQPVPRERHLLLELCGNDDRFEHLTTAAWKESWLVCRLLRLLRFAVNKSRLTRQVLDVDKRRLEPVFQRCGERLAGHAGVRRGLFCAHCRQYVGSEQV